MHKYRKKPVVIEAIQFDGLNGYEIKRFAGSAVITDIDDAAYQAGIAPPIMSVHIETLEGTMRADVGDYVIQGVNGEIYPCKPDIFAKTYELAESEE